MRIVFLCNEYPPCPHLGGIGVFTHTMAHGLVDAGHKVTVLGYGGEPGERDDRGVRVAMLPESNTRHMAWLLNRRRLHAWLQREVRAGGIDIVETPEYQGMLPFRLRKCPVAVRLHGSVTTLAWSDGEKTRRINRWLESRTLSLHRNWIPVSRYILDATRRCFQQSPLRHRVIYNPLRPSGGDIGDVPLADMPEQYVLFAGTVSDAKGAFVLAQAARTFLAAYPNLHLVYVGKLTMENGRRADESIRAIVGEQLAARVRFTGVVHRDQVLVFMRGARVFAFPSKREAFALVCIEAMSCGIPIVYSARHSGPEAVDDGVTGLLADPNSPKDVAEKVLRLLEDPIFAKRLAKSAEEAAKERFSLDRCVEDTLAFYRRCLRERTAA